MRIASLSATVLAVAILTTSCLKDNVILYREITMATVTAPNQFLTDAGLTYNVVQKDIDDDFSDFGRVLIYCNILKETASNEFDVELLALIKPLNKDAVLTSTLTKPDDGLGNDPVAVTSAWVSGGYLNMSIAVLALDETKDHFINLEFDDTAPQDTLRFTLRHEDNVSDELNVISEDSALGAAYVTFPVEKLLPEGVTTMPIKLSWTWDKEYCVKDALKL